MVLGATIAALTLAPSAGATDGYIPAQSTSILVPGYVPAVDPATGLPHGDSIHAVCDGPGFIEVGVHPFDGVARNLQVFDVDGQLLVNVTSADHAELVAITDQPATLRYSGGATYQLDLEACTTEPPPPSSSVPTTEAPAPPATVGTTVAAPPETLPMAQEAAAVATDTQVLTSTIAQLPATGPSQRLIDLGTTLIVFGLAILWAGRRVKAGRS